MGNLLAWASCLRLSIKQCSNYFQCNYRLLPFSDFISKGWREMFREGFKDCLCILHLCLLITNDLAWRPSAYPKLRNTTWRSGERGRAAFPSSCCPGEGPVSGQGHKAAFQPSSPLAGGDSLSLRLASRY